MSRSDDDEEDTPAKRRKQRFQNFVSLLIAIEAVLLTIASLGGSNAAKTMINANIQASDTWAFYQAKNVRQTVYNLAADELEATLLLAGPDVPAASREKLEASIAGYRGKAKRYESEPDAEDPDNPIKGEGKKELMARARHYEEQRDYAGLQDPNFDYSTALLQIAIVLGSIAILVESRGIVALSLALSVFATLMTLNGYYLIVPL